MSYNVYTPASVAAALSDLATFYQSTMGWTVNYDSQNDILDVEIPGKPVTFKLSKLDFSDYSATSGGANFEILVLETVGTSEPIRAQTNWLNPVTRLFVHAEDSGPEPWSLITFESAPGYFHHSYFGYVEKIGSYTGGAIVDGTGWDEGLGSQEKKWGESDNHLLFKGHYDKSEDGNWGKQGGGMEIIHPDAGADAFFFNFASGSYALGGGLGDGYNQTLAWAEPAGVDGSLNMHPIILFAALQANDFITPVACVPGVRMINCGAIDPAQTVTIGGDTWQVFPATNKDVPYGGDLGPGSGPGNIQPDSGGNYDINIGGGTERIGIAVKHEV